MRKWSSFIYSPYGNVLSQDKMKNAINTVFLIMTCVALLMVANGCWVVQPWEKPKTVILDHDTFLLDTLKVQKSNQRYRSITLDNVDHIPDWVYDQSDLRELCIMNDANEEDFQEVNKDTIWIDERFFRLSSLEELTINSYHIQYKGQVDGRIEHLQYCDLAYSTMPSGLHFMCWFPNLRFLNLRGVFAKGNSINHEKERCPLQLDTLLARGFKTDSEDDLVYLAKGNFKKLTLSKSFIFLDKEVLKHIHADYLDVSLVHYPSIDTSVFIRKVDVDTLVLSSNMLSDSIGAIDVKFENLIIDDYLFPRRGSGEEYILYTQRVKALKKANPELKLFYTDRTPIE